VFISHHRHAFFASKTISRTAIRALAMAALAFTVFGANAQSSGDTPLGKELLTAMRRDLGLDAQQAAQYVRAERAAIVLAPKVERELGASFGGSWLERGANGEFALVVAVTDETSAARARAQGANPRIVRRSLSQLNATKDKLDVASRQRKPGAGVYSWYVDVQSNQVVIVGHPKAQWSAAEFASASGVDAAGIRFIASEATPQPAQIVGGERYNIGSGGGCSIGFPVLRGSQTGFATAGHCGPVGTATLGVNGGTQGYVANSTYPVADSAWVRLSFPSAWPLRNWVNNYAGGSVPIVGQAPAPVGAAICRSGWRTGYRCGVVIANNITVFYGQDEINGLTSTSACIGKGDSGGSYITPAGQAQGVASGGFFVAGTDENCGSASPISYHQPIVPLLNLYNLTLYTGGPIPPAITAFVCPQKNNTGPGQYFCYAQFSQKDVTATWNGGVGNTVNGAGYSEFYGTCTPGELIRAVRVVATNSAGSTSITSASFNCPNGPKQ
jgi:hypothetical protein